MTELISIALCTYNGSDFLQMQLKSILDQSYRNIEVIIVDDNSIDDTINLLKAAALDDERIKLVLNKENIGFNANFEKAIKLCSGDFIAIADQDDIWKLNKLELLRKNIGNKWLIFSNSSFIDEHGSQIKGQILADKFNLSRIDFKGILFSNLVTGHTALFSKSFLPYLLPIPRKGFYDWWMGFVAIYHSNATYLDKKLTLHRIHNKSVMYKNADQVQKLGRTERYREIINNLEVIEDYKNLISADKAFVSAHLKAYRRLNFTDKLFLIRTFYKNYDSFFPMLKSRKGVGRLNYARKLIKKLY